MIRVPTVNILDRMIILKGVRIKSFEFKLVPGGLQHGLEITKILHGHTYAGVAVLENYLVCFVVKPYGYRRLSFRRALGEVFDANSDHPLHEF